MSREPALCSATRSALVGAAALAGVVVLAYSAVALAPPGAPTAAWWPAVGLAVALGLLAPGRRAYVVLPLTWVLIAAAIWLGGRPADLAVGFGLANAAEVAVVAAVLHRCGVRDRVRLAWTTARSRRGDVPAVRLEDLGWLVVAAVGGGAVGAGLISTTLMLAGLGQTAPEALRNVFVAHVAGTLLVVPTVLVLRGPRGPFRWEVVLQALALASATSITLLVSDAGGLLALAPLPLLVWAALRLGPRVVLLELIAVSIAVTVAARVGAGPFVGVTDDPARAYLMGALVQSYIICAILTALPLAVTMEQRSALLDRVLSSERGLRRGFEESVVGLLQVADDPTDPDDLRIVDLNAVASRMLARDPDAAGGGRLGDLLDLDPLEVRATVLGGDPWRGEVGLRGRPGTRIGVAVSAAEQSLGEGTATFSAQLVDLTPVHEAHQRADRERELSRAVAESAACLILLVDLDGLLVGANPAATTMLGWEEEELVGRFVWELLPADRQGDLRRAIAGLPHSAPPRSSEADLLCRDGSRRRVLWTTDHARDPDGAPTLLVMTGIDVTSERQQKLLVSQLLEAAMTTAIIGADADGRIAFFNTGAERLLGRSATEAVGAPFVEILAPGARAERWGAGSLQLRPEEAFFVLASEIEPGRPPVPEDLRWQSADGSTRTVSTTLSTVSDPDLGVGYLCIGRDVTEQRQTQELLTAALDKERTAVERLQALDHAKNDFVSTVSHELRTPVTSIVGYTEVLRDGTVEAPRADQAGFLDAIARNADRLIGLADDLLTLSGLESGVAEMGRETLDLADLVETSRTSLTPLLCGRDLAVTYRLASPVMVSGDADHLDRVLVNLVGNAAKFTDDGGRIEVVVAAEDGEAVLTVSDTGIGIPAEEQSRLFTKFFRSTTAQQRAIQGTGLGLSIVHSIVTAHGGRILVRSAHLAGTTFSVRLPLRTAPDRTTEPPATPRPELVASPEPLHRGRTATCGVSPGDDG